MKAGLTVRLMVVAGALCGALVCWGAKTVSLDLGSARSGASLVSDLPGDRVIRLTAGEVPAELARLDVGDSLAVRLAGSHEVCLRLVRQVSRGESRSVFLARSEGSPWRVDATVVQNATGVSLEVHDSRTDSVWSVVVTREGGVVRQLSGRGRASTPVAPKYLPRVGSSRSSGKLAAALSPQQGPLLWSRGELRTNVVDILIASDVSAREYVREAGYESFDDFAEHAVQMLNVCLVNSGLDDVFSFNLAGTVEMAGDYASADFDSFLDVLTMGNLADAKKVRAAREACHADIVSCLVWNHVETQGGLAGLGYGLYSDQWNQLDNYSEYAYCMCGIGALERWYTLAHEVGHIMGAGHPDRIHVSYGPGPQFFPYSSGYYFTVEDSRYATIMGYSSNGLESGTWTIVPFFSSPRLTFGYEEDGAWVDTGVDLGTPVNDNARTLRDTAAAVANFRVASAIPLDAEYGPFIPGVAVTNAIPAGAGCTVSGLPPGLKWNAKDVLDAKTKTVKVAANTVTGVPTKPGSYTVTFSKQVDGRSADGRVTRVTQRTTSIFVVDPLRSVVVRVIGSGTGKVTGGGAFAAGKKITLKATPDKKDAPATAKAAAQVKSVFAGWFADEQGEIPLTGTADFRTPSFSYVVTAEPDAVLYAKFLSIADDAEIALSLPDATEDGVWTVTGDAAASEYAVCRVEVSSASLPTVTAKGLPSGCTYDKNAGRLVFKKQPAKPGTWVVALTAKNTSGAVTTESLKVVVPNLRSDVYAGIDYEREYEYTVGEDGTCLGRDVFEVKPGWKVTASGLPSGVKLVFAPGAEDSPGSVSFSGTPSKAGTYTVTLTAKSGKQTERATFTLTVNPFPKAAVGTYAGVLLADGFEDPGAEFRFDSCDVRGTFSLTVAANGKMTAKVVSAGTTISLSGYACSVGEDEIVLDLADKKGNRLTGMVYPHATFGVYQVEGAIEGVKGVTGALLAQRNGYKDVDDMKDVAKALAKVGKMAGVAEGDATGGAISGAATCSACAFSSGITVTVAANGTVKVAGKIAGNAISGSSQLTIASRPDDGFDVYADFYQYKTGKGGLSCRVIFDWDFIVANQGQQGIGSRAIAGGKYDCR